MVDGKCQCLLWFVENDYLEISALQQKIITFSVD